MKLTKILTLVVLIVYSFASLAGATKVGGGGVFFVPIHAADITDSNGVDSGDSSGSGGPSMLYIKAEDDGNNFPALVSQKMIEKLKKLGVEKLVLENGETIDLSAISE